MIFYFIGSLAHRVMKCLKKNEANIFSVVSVLVVRDFSRDFFLARKPIGFMKTYGSLVHVPIIINVIVM